VGRGMQKVTTWTGQEERGGRTGASEVRIVTDGKKNWEGMIDGRMSVEGRGWGERTDKGDSGEEK